MNEQNSGEWMTYPQAATRLGISPEAVRQRVKRGVMTGSRTNDGRPRAWVSSAETVQGVDRRTVDQKHVGGAEPFTPQAGDGSQTVAGHNETVRQPDATVRLIEFLERQIEQERAAREKLEERHVAALDREKAQHLAEIKRLEAAYKAATNALMERIATVLVANRRRSWWHWFG